MSKSACLLLRYMFHSNSCSAHIPNPIHQTCIPTAEMDKLVSHHRLQIPRKAVCSLRYGLYPLSISLPTRLYPQPCSLHENKASAC